MVWPVPLTLLLVFSSARCLKCISFPAEKNALEQFCVDLTARVSEGLIDPVIGRETEVQRIIEILCRRTKNNPILLGQAGVGKTAIAEGLAINIAEGNIPAFLMVGFSMNSYFVFFLFFRGFLEPFCNLICISYTLVPLAAAPT